jgi:hypothetical protein
MDHERAVASVVGAGVLQAESVRKLEVDLERGDLPAPSDRVADVHVDLGRVEGALPLGHEVVEARGVQRLLQGGLGLVPFLRGADELLRPGRQLRLELGQPEGAEQAQDELQQAGQLAAQLLTGAENVGIVPGFVDLAARHRALSLPTRWDQSRHEHRKRPRAGSKVKTRSHLSTALAVSRSRIREGLRGDAELVALRGSHHDPVWCRLALGNCHREPAAQAGIRVRTPRVDAALPGLFAAPRFGDLGPRGPSS